MQLLTTLINNFYKFFQENIFKKLSLIFNDFLHSISLITKNIYYILYFLLLYNKKIPNQLLILVKQEVLYIINAFKEFLNIFNYIYFVPFISLKKKLINFIKAYKIKFYHYLMFLKIECILLIFIITSFKTKIITYVSTFFNILYSYYKHYTKIIIDIKINIITYYFFLKNLVIKHIIKLPEYYLILTTIVATLKIKTIAFIAILNKIIFFFKIKLITFINICIKYFICLKSIFLDIKHKFIKYYPIFITILITIILAIKNTIIKYFKKFFNTLIYLILFKNKVTIYQAKFMIFKKKFIADYIVVKDKFIHYNIQFIKTWKIVINYLVLGKNQFIIYKNKFLIFSNIVIFYLIQGKIQITILINKIFINLVNLKIKFTAYNTNFIFFLTTIIKYVTQLKNKLTPFFIKAKIKINLNVSNDILYIFLKKQYMNITNYFNLWYLYIVFLLRNSFNNIINIIISIILMFIFSIIDCIFSILFFFLKKFVNISVTILNFIIISIWTIYFFIANIIVNAIAFVKFILVTIFFFKDIYYQIYLFIFDFTNFFYQYVILFFVKYLKALSTWFCVFLLIITNFSFLYIYYNWDEFISKLFFDVKYFLKNSVKYLFNLFKNKLFIKFRKSYFFYNESKFFFIVYFILKIKISIFILFNVVQKNLIKIFWYLKKNWTNLFNKILYDLIAYFNFWNLSLIQQLKVQISNTQSLETFSMSAMFLLFAKSLFFLFISSLFWALVVCLKFVKFLFFIIPPFTKKIILFWKLYVTYFIYVEQKKKKIPKININFFDIFLIKKSKIKKILLAKKITPSLFILKPEISSIISIFNRIFSIALYIYTYICIFFYAWSNFTCFLDYLFTVIIIFLFFYHIFYSRLKLNLFINNLTFLIGNNFKLINFIYYFFLAILVAFTLCWSSFIFYFIFFKDISLINHLKIIYQDIVNQNFLEIFMLVPTDPQNKEYFLYHINILDDFSIFYFNFFDMNVIDNICDYLSLIKQDLKNVNFYFYLFLILFFKIFIVFVLSLFFPVTKNIIKKIMHIFIKLKFFFHYWIFSSKILFISFFFLIKKNLSTQPETPLSKKYTKILKRLYNVTFSSYFINNFFYLKIKTGDISYFLYKCLNQFFYLILLTIFFFLILDLYLLFFENTSLNLDWYELISIIQNKFYFHYENICGCSNVVADIVLVPHWKEFFFFTKKENLNIISLVDYTNIFSTLSLNMFHPKQDANNFLYFFSFYIYILYLYFYYLFFIFSCLLYIHLFFNFSNILKDYINIISVYYYNLLNFFFKIIFFLLFITKIIFFIDIVFIYFINNIIIFSILYTFIYFFIWFFGYLNNYLNRGFLKFLFNYYFIINTIKYFLIYFFLGCVILFIYFIIFFSQISLFIFFFEIFDERAFYLLLQDYNLNLYRGTQIHYNLFFQNNLIIYDFFVLIYHNFLMPFFKNLFCLIFFLLFNTLHIDFVYAIIHSYILYFFDFILEKFFFAIDYLLIYFANNYLKEFLSINIDISYMVNCFQKDFFFVNYYPINIIFYFFVYWHLFIKIIIIMLSWFILKLNFFSKWCNPVINFVLYYITIIFGLTQNIAAILLWILISIILFLL